MWQGFRAAAVVAAVAVLAAFAFHSIWPEEGSTPQSEVQGDPNTSSPKPRKGKGAAGSSYPRLEAAEHAPGARVWTTDDLALHDGENLGCSVAYFFTFWDSWVHSILQLT